MDAVLRANALRRHGLLLAAEARQLPVAQQRALVEVQPGVLAAATTPLSHAAHVLAVELAAPSVVLSGRTAAWAHGLVAPGAVVDVSVPATSQLVLRPPARVRRLAPRLLQGVRQVGGHRVVAVETAVVQTAEGLSRGQVVDVVEAAVRARQTTTPRVRASCIRGVSGSALLRSVMDEMAEGAVDLWPRRLRRALERAGVRGLESEVRLLGPSGEVAYVDLLCRRARRAVEVDGWDAHGRRTAFVADRRRDRWLLQHHGITTTRVAVAELRQDLARVVEELLPLLAAGDGDTPLAVDL